MGNTLLKLILKKGRATMRKRYTIEIAENSHLVIYCPQELLKDNVIKKIAFGSRAIEADFRPHPNKNNNSIVISNEMQKLLLFPDFAIKFSILDRLLEYLQQASPHFLTGRLAIEPTFSPNCYR
jgi:hypothetical protein